MPIALAGDTTNPTRLSVEKAEGGALLLAWEETKSGELEDPTIYEGSLEALNKGHWDLEPVDCDTGEDRREEILPTPGSRYYLLVPRPAKRRSLIERGGATIPSRPRPTPCTLKRQER